MNTAARFWLLLTPFYLVAHSLLFVLLWHTIDLSLEAVIQHLAVPFSQALALAWVMRAFSLKDFVLAAKRAGSILWVAGLWCGIGGLLFLYWLPLTGTNIGGIVARVAGIELLLAAVLFLIYFINTTGLRKCIAFFAFAILLLILGSNGIWPWYHFVPHCFPDRWPILISQALVLCGTVICLIGLAGRAEAFVSARNPLAGIILGWVQPFVIVAAMALAVNGYLYPFLVSPWVHVVTVSIILGATCLLASALCLRGTKKPDSEKTFSPVKNHSEPINPLVCWFVLASCALACVTILRVFFFPHWDVSTRTVLAFLFVPLLQTYWLRWAQELYRCWRYTVRLFKHEYMFFVLICIEMTLLCYIAFSKNLWDKKDFLIIASLWVGLKLFILGAKTIWVKRDGDFFGRYHKICGAITLILGAGTAFMGGLSNWIWMLPAMGSASVLVAVRRRTVALNHSARLARATAEAFVVLLLSMSFCILITPLGHIIASVIYSGYILAALATTFVAMFLHALMSDVFPAGKSDDPPLVEPIFHKT